MRHGLTAVAALGAAAVLSLSAAAQQFQLDMTGAQEVPGPGDPDGSATGILTIDQQTSKISWDFTYEGIVTPTLMHIHTGAAGVAGPVLVNMGVVTMGGPGTLINMTTAPAATIANILANPAGFYVNIHNAPFPSGAVRGQLVPADPTWKWVGGPGPVQDWTDPANWMGGNGGGFPNNPEAKVMLGDVIQVPTMIKLPVPITMTALTFGGAHPYTIGGPGSEPMTFINPGLTPIDLQTPVENVLCGDIKHSCIIVSGVPASCLVFDGDISGINDGPASLIMPPVNVCDVILTGSNTFAGEVVVNGGQLKLMPQVLGPAGLGCPTYLHTIPDDVPLVIGPGGKVNVAAGFVEAVGALILAGNAQPPGLYPAAPPFLAGGGVIKVLSPCPADFNNDGSVDGADLGFMLAAWDTCNLLADLNEDGTVDGADLGALLAEWGPC